MAQARGAGVADAQAASRARASRTSESAGYPLLFIMQRVMTRAVGGSQAICPGLGMGIEGGGGGACGGQLEGVGEEGLALQMLVIWLQSMPWSSGASSWELDCASRLSSSMRACVLGCDERYCKESGMFG